MLSFQYFTPQKPQSAAMKKLSAILKPKVCGCNYETAKYKFEAVCSMLRNANS